MACGCNKKNKNGVKKAVDRGKKTASKKSLPLITIRRKSSKTTKK